jgi:hypothetical protein
VYPVNPLTIRYDVVPADGQEPERPMDGVVTIKLDGRQVATSSFKGKPVTVVLAEKIDTGPRTVTVEYGGPWGVWADSSASVQFTVDKLPVTPVLDIDPAGPLGAAPVLSITVPGMIAGDWQGFTVWVAEEGTPDDWVLLVNQHVWTYRPLQLPAYDRPVLFKAVWMSGTGGYRVAESNVVAFGYSWQTVANNHPTWQDVADTRSSWFDVSRRG